MVSEGLEGDGDDDGEGGDDDDDDDAMLMNQSQIPNHLAPSLSLSGLARRDVEDAKRLRDSSVVSYTLYWDT
jgi:hypothetical protein